MNPKRPLALRVYQALTGFLFNEEGRAVPAYEHVPADYTGGSYVFLSQYTASEQPAGICRADLGPAWRCTLLTDALTRFPTESQASTDPGDYLSEQVQTQLRTLAGQDLGMGFAVESVTVELTTGFGELQGDAYWLHNTTRFAFVVRQVGNYYSLRTARITTDTAYRLSQEAELRLLV